MSKTERIVLKSLFNEESNLHCHLQSIQSQRFENVLSDDSIVDLLTNLNRNEVNFQSNIGYKVLGISALQLFVKHNWFCCDIKLREDLLRVPEENVDLSSICKNDESPSSQAKNISLLSIAMRCLSCYSKSSLSDIVWYWRCLIVNQMILQEPSARLYEEFKTLSSLFNELIDEFSTTNNDQKLSSMQFCLELSQTFLWFKDVQNCDKYLKKANEYSEISFDLSGALGKRTKFQAKPTSLLKVDIQRNVEREVNDTENLQFPHNVELNDETLLKTITFEENSCEVTKLCPEEYALILASVTLSLKAGPHRDELVKEEALAYLEHIIINTSTWVLKYKALYLRSLLEQENKKIERTMMQLNELVDSYKDVSQVNINKLDLFYCALPEPIWMTEKCFADCLLSLGCVKSALDIYSRLELWESIVHCYQQLQRRDKAEEIVRKQMEVEKTPYLLCLLGDVTYDVSCYEEAWSLSKCRSSRAQKSLGDYYFERKEYSKCIDYYQKSLELNSLQLNTWQRLGFAALDTELYDLSAQAYRRFLQFEYDTFEAWNNLSKVYVKLNDKPRAWKTLQEALKCNYEEWRIWENYLLVSIDVGAFDEVVNAWHRLIDLKGKHYDDDVADILAKVACNEIEVKSGNFVIDKFREKVQTLFGRVTAVGGICSEKQWTIYAKLLLHKEDELCKIINCLKKALHSGSAKANWEKDVSDIERVLTNVINVNDLYSRCLDKYGISDELNSALQSFRLSVKSVLRTVDLNKNYWRNDEKRETIESLLASVDCILNNLLLRLS